jgi:ABC-type branched-subunit amino acid transport system substrate-binding protein
MATKYLTGAALGLALTTPAFAPAARAEDGVYANKIVFGQAAALSGPSAALGTGMREGLMAALSEANHAGGVKGRLFALISRDDGYEPNKSIAAARQLIEHDKIFALVGSVGTPTAVAVQPIADEEGVPFIGAFTGAEFLRNPYKSDVVNVRASYFQETEAMVEHLTRDLGVTHIGLFFQDDAFGRAGRAGVRRALDTRHMQLVSEGSYTRNTIAVEDALQSIRTGDPQAVIMIGAYKPCAQFIRLARAAKFDPTFVNISFVGIDALAHELGPQGAGVFVTEVVPFPEDTSIGIVRRYQAALHSYNAGDKPGYVSLEGYVVGRLVVTAMERTPGEITRKSWLDTITRTGRFDLGGMTLTYGPDNNRGSNDVFLTEIQPDGSSKPVDRLTK